jgi:quercetin dioxygenase-like cupin family protein
MNCATSQEEQTMTAGKVDFDSIPWTTPMPNVRVKVHKDEKRQLRLVEFSQGFEEPDWCRRGHVGFVLEGTGRLQFQHSQTLLTAGNGVFIPPGEEHKHKLTVLSKTVKVVLVEEVPCHETLK